jgi:hypothetical protein
MKEFRDNMTIDVIEVLFRVFMASSAKMEYIDLK